MGIFADYVDAYADLTQGYLNSGTPNYDSYVNDSSDLLKAYEATGTPDYVQYVLSYPDLKKAVGSDKADVISKWGKSHWESNGSREGRTLPKTYPQNKATWGKSHWESYGSREGRTLPRTYSQTKEQWGTSHWNSNGKNEDRIVPGTAKLEYKNGSLSIAANALIGSGAATAYNNIVTQVNNSTGGNYQTLIENFNKSLGSVKFNDLFDGGSKAAIDSFYIKNKVGAPWDAVSQGAKPPTGGFDVNYYQSRYPDALTEWNKAQAVNIGGRTFQDLDITSRYDKNTYLLQHYTNVGRHAGYRANQALEAEQATKYTETLTDYEKQLYRDQVLGITTQGGKDFINLATPQYDAEGRLLNEAELNTVLEQNIASTLTAESGRQEKQLQLLAQDVLQQSINELKKAKEKESNLMLMKNLPTYSEIMNINTTLTNSILGDASFGGMLGFVDPKKTFKTQLEKDIGGLTGVSSNSTVYNWQKWFDDTLMKRYETFELDLEDRTPEEIKQYQDQAKRDITDYNAAIKVNPQAEKPLLLQKAEQYKLDINNADQFKELLLKVDQDSQKQFLGSFINGYIKPRFDQSKSMDEFVSYLDVKEEEQNIFQSQSVVNKLKQIAELRSNAMLSFYKTTEAAKKGFDSDFYLDPVAKATKDLTTSQKLAYENQKSIVNADFNAAKNGRISNGVDWAAEAYRYGYEGTYKTNPQVFAKLHYQVLGSTGQLKDSEGNSIVLDPAENILGYNELQKKITEATEELVIRKDLYGDTAFMKFVTPEEFADSILQSVSPEKNKEEWEKILKQIGLEGEEATVENVKQYLIDSFRTEEAKNIRESIKYLNEQKETLNQEKLGVSYIEREADKSDISAEPETQLYQIFKSAGFEGSEDDFYTSFMPDVDREEQKVLSKAMSQKGLAVDSLDLSDPFSAFSNISSFFDKAEEPATTTEKTTDSTKSSYFNIFGGDEEKLPTKSKAAQSILGEFTSMFKGFS